MDREFYLDLAAKRLAMPIGADLVLSGKEDPQGIRLDGKRLGGVLVEAARKYRTPLAFPLMDLQIEKAYLLEAMGHDPDAADVYHIDEDELESSSKAGLLEKVHSHAPTPKMTAAMEAISRVAEEADLVSMGMSIGPFSLLTKLMDDPITTLYMASTGEEGEEEHDFVHGILELATQVILRWIGLQINAGAKAICVCEPAANTVYLSPRQLSGKPIIFDRFVIDYNRRIVDLMDSKGVDLIFHDCGELLPMMISKFRQLRPVILSLGSPVPLWDAAAHTDKDTVLFGNLPSKKFYSDKEYPESRLEEEAARIRRKMDATGHPYILGSECDVLAVSGCECSIRRKTDLLLRC